MSENKHQLNVVIGATLNSGFSSAVGGSTAKIQKLGGAIQTLEKNSAVTGKALDKLKNQHTSLLTAMNRQQAIVQKRGFYRSQIMGVAALGAALVAPIKSAMDFESSLAEIKSVVDFEKPDSLQKLGDVFLKMSRTIPVTADEFANIAAVGGRFGVAANELAGFSEEVAKTAVAWRAPVNETAERVGNLMKNFNLTASQLPNYFNAINYLGNKTGATADNILQAINRSADGLANFKLSIPQVAALTGTIMSFGEGAEQAGSAVGNMLQKLSIAPQLGATAQKALHSIGLSSVTLPKMIQQDPQKVLDKLFAGVAKMDPEKHSSVLYGIFGRGASKMVGKIVDNLDLYRKNLALVQDSKSYKGSRNGDYDIVLETAQAQLKLLSSTMSSFMKVVGFALLPTLKSVVSGIRNVISPVITWMEKNKELTQTITKIVGGFIAFRIAIFSLGYASTFLFGGLNRLRLCFQALRNGAGLLGGVFRALLSGPFGKLALLFGGAYVLVSKLNSGIKEGLRSSLETIFQTASEIFSKLKQELSQLDFKNFGSVFVSVFEKIKKNIKGMGKSSEPLKLAGAFVVLRIVTGTLSLVFQMLSSVLKFTFGTIGFVTRAFWTLATVGIPAVFKAGGLLFKTFWFLSTEVIPTMVRGVFFVGGCLKKLAFEWIPAVVSGFGRFTGAALQMVGTAIFPVISGLGRLTLAMKTLYLQGMQKLMTSFPKLGLAVKALMVTGGILALATAAYMIYQNWDRLKEFFLNIWDGISEKWSAFTEKAGELWENLQTKVEPLSKALRTVGGIIAETVVFTMQLGKVIFEVLRNATALIAKFVFGKDTVIPAWEELKNFFGDFWNDIEPKWNEFLAKIKGLGFVDKIKASWEFLGTFFEDLWKRISPNFGEWLKPLESVWSKIKGIFPGSLFSEGRAANANLKLPEVAPEKTVRTQNNNFTININGAKNDNAESLADKVMRGISSFGKTFLYDEVPGVL